MEYIPTIKHNGQVIHLSCHFKNANFFKLLMIIKKQNYIYIIKTFWNILGVPYLNQYDAGASDLADMFTDVPDLTPYKAVPSDKRFFDPQKALDPFDEKFDWKALKEGPEMDDMEDMIRESRKQDRVRLSKKEQAQRISRD